MSEEDRTERQEMVKKELRGSEANYSQKRRRVNRTGRH